MVLLSGSTRQQLEVWGELVLTLALFVLGLWMIGLERLHRWGGGSVDKVCRDDMQPPP